MYRHKCDVWYLITVGFMAKLWTNLVVVVVVTRNGGKATFMKAANTGKLQPQDRENVPS